MLRIFIPVYNEELNIERCVRGIHEELRRTSHKFYLVNDGSRDGTGAIIKKMSRTLPVMQLKHEVNQGVAQAFRTGLGAIAREAGRGDLVAVMEADGTSDPKLLSEMVGKINQGHDVVIASRYGPRGRYVRFPFKRLFLSKSANWLLKLVFGLPGVKDYTIFYRVYRVELLKKLVAKYGDGLIKTRMFSANAEVLVKCRGFDPRICEVGFVYDYGRKKGPSSMKILKNIWQYFLLILYE